MPASDSSGVSAPSDASIVFRCEDTGESVDVPSTTLLARPDALRARILRTDVQSAWAGPNAASAVHVDVSARTYRFARYPPLSFFVDTRLVIVLGAFFLAGCAQVFFFFPCLSGFTLVMPSGAPTVGATNPGYCVDNSVLGTLSSSPAESALKLVASKRIAVTMQTFGVMMLGAIAGRVGGAAAAALYVFMVCMGAPFQASSGGVGLAMWNKGAIVGVSGGFFWGFIAAALIMGRAMERGAGRGASWRSALWLIPHMVCAELAIYACGLFWYPFAKAILAGVAVGNTPVLGCSSAAGGEVSANKCLYTIFNIMMVPYLPGECFKMALVLALVPLTWWALIKWQRWRRGDIVMAIDEEEAGAEEAGTAPKATEVRNGIEAK